MSKEVVIKSNRYGINLILDGQIPFQELLLKISDKFKETGDFFKDAKMAISFEGRELTMEEEQKIIDAIMANSSIQIVSIVDRDQELEEKMHRSVEAYMEASRQAAYVPEEFDMVNELEEETGTDFYMGSLRSGQMVESTSSITVVGDVNPGAKVVSMGNVVILGSLKGNAQAGAGGKRDSFIFALEMKPIQLQIGDLIAKSPDREKGEKRAKKKEKDSVNSYVPQIAVARDGNICIEPVKKGSFGRL